MDKELRNLEHSMCMALDTRKSNYGSKWWLRFHIWFVMTLYFQNTTDVITKFDSYFIAKCKKNMSDFYYKMRRLLQIASVQY